MASAFLCLAPRPTGNSTSRHFYRCLLELLLPFLAIASWRTTQLYSSAPSAIPPIESVSSLRFLLEFSGVLRACGHLARHSLPSPHPFRSIAYIISVHCTLASGGAPPAGSKTWGAHSARKLSTRRTFSVVLRGPGTSDCN